MGVLVGGPILDRFGIEDHQVREVPLFQDPPVPEPETAGRVAAQLVDRLFQGEKLPVPHTGTQQAGTRSVVPGMDEASFMVDPVAAHHVVAVAQKGLHHGVVPPVKHQQDRQVLLDEQVGDGVGRGESAPGDVVAHGRALKVVVALAGGPGDDRPIQGRDVQDRGEPVPEPARPELVQSRHRSLVPDLVGHEEIEHGGPGQVGIDVEGEVHLLGGHPVHVIEDLFGRRFVDGLEVGDVDRNSRSLADLHRLLQGRHDSHLVAHVGRIQTLGRHDPAGPDQFVGGGVALGDVVQPRGDADGARFHSLFDLPQDLSHLDVVRRLPTEPAGQRADVGVGDVRDAVLHRPAIQQPHVFGEAFPALVLLQPEPIERSQVVDPGVGGLPVDGGIGDPVGHDHFGGEPLGRLGQEVGVREQPRIGVIVDVHESWSHDPPPGVDPVAGLLAGQVSDLLNPVPANAQIRPVARIAGAVDKNSALNDEFQHDARF